MLVLKKLELSHFISVFTDILQIFIARWHADRLLPGPLSGKQPWTSQRECVFFSTPGPKK